jgi:electron transport complex protein RnfB
VIPPGAVSADDIDALLPQTQCTQCGFAGCRPYAEAIARGEADINRCPPGGAAGIERLAALTGATPGPLDATCGTEGEPTVVVIDESRCIGCTLCIQACPVDAIVGASKRMHTVLLDECSGCNLCIAPCPVDCIAIVTADALRASGHRIAPRPPDAWRDRANHWRTRFDARRVRLERAKVDRAERLEAKATRKLAALPEEDPEIARKRAVIEAALARARARRTPPSGATPT